MLVGSELVTYPFWFTQAEVHVSNVSTALLRASGYVTKSK